MGWSFENTRVSDVCGYLKRALEGENDKSIFRHLASSKVGDVVYIATEFTNKILGETKVMGTVVLTENKNGEFGYKIMDEDMGPFYYDCPPKILKLLSPTDCKQASEWRQKCLENHH
jgi:hypothetical protein